MVGSIAQLLRVRLPLFLTAPLVALALVVGGGVGYLLALRLTSPCPLSAAECQQLGNFWRTWELAADYYVDPEAVDPAEMADGAIAGMLDSLGDAGHTRYLDPEAAAAERESMVGRFEGIGVYLDVRDDQPLIVAPIEGSPAEQASVKAGDLILRVNGEETVGMTIDELRARVRGPKGTPVTLTLQREGLSEPFDVTITRDEINVRSVTWRLLPDEVALIKVNRFAQRTGEELRVALEQTQQAGARALVLDLRDNGGGLVSQLVLSASQFLPTGSTVMIEEDREGNRRSYTTGEGGVALDIPLVVLVNSNTASAGEILAGALRDAGRAQVIGQPTFGTATVLQPFELSDGAQVRIGTSQWLTPKGEEVRGRGIEPDELVALPPGVEPLTPAAAAELSAQELLNSDDVQLVRGLELLRGMARAP